MNYKLILGLAALGLGMAFASVYSIPSDIEPICWVAVFLVSTYFVATMAPGKFFLHAFLICFIDCLFATGTQVLLSATYLARHKVQVDMYEKLHTQTGLSPEQIILISRPAIGIVLGVLVGILANIAAGYFSTGTPAPALQPAAYEPEDSSEPYLSPYLPGGDQDNSYLTDAAQAGHPSSLVYSLVVLINPTEKQIEWINSWRDNENAVTIPNVMDTPIKGLTFSGMHAHLME